MRKMFLITVVLVGGTIVVALINGMIGFSMSNYTFWQTFVHNGANLCLGAATWWAITRSQK